VSARVAQTGQALTETLVATLVIAAALLSPWLGGVSPAALLLGALVGVSSSFQGWLFLL
jgi:hypothetical protein